MKNGKEYFVIFEFMYNRLGLSGANLLVFALVYSYCASGSGRFFGTRAHLAERTGLSVSSVARALDELCDRGLIIKEERSGVMERPSYRLGKLNITEGEEGLTDVEQDSTEEQAESGEASE